MSITKNNGDTNSSVSVRDEKSNYVLYFDLLNIAACIAVVALHVNETVWTFSRERSWITSMIIETVFYWAVPVFFMLTGATLMNYRKRYDTKTFFKKRLLKTAVPFLFWSVAFIPWGLTWGKTLPSDTHLGVKSVIDIILNTKSMPIFWFFMPLFATYLCIPFFSVIAEEKRKFAFSYLAVFSFVTISCLPLLCTLVGLSFNSRLENPAAGAYIMFVLIGYLLANYELSPRLRYILYALGVAGWAIRFFFTIYLSYNAGSIVRTFGEYTNMPSVLLAVGVFVWFRYHDWSLLSGKRCVKVIRTLSGASFGVYIVHYFIMRSVTDYFNINMFSWLWRVFGVPLIYLSALAVILIFKKIPIIRKLVP